jgi:hypothetical protein
VAVLIGPDMRCWERQSASGGIVSAHEGTLHASGADATRPDAAMLFNSGVGCLLNPPLVAAWLPSMARLLALDVPILLTCYDVRESISEEEILSRCFEARALGPPVRNPFGFVTPAQAFRRLSETQAALLVRKQAHENRAQQPAPESIPRDDVALLVSRETAQPHPVSNRHLRWWGGSTLTTAEMEGPRAAMVTALVRAFNTDAQ